MAVQLARPVTDDTVTLGSYWPRIRQEYPHLQPQPGLPPMAERFDERAVPPQIEFQVLNAPPPTRYWLLNESSTELVQVQPDRFAFNWRKETSDTVYPRYTYLRDRFTRLFSEFVSTVGEANREVEPEWCEITYVNPIDARTEDGGRADLSTVLRRFNPHEVPSLPRPEDSSFSERFLLTRADAPYGRFHVNIAPGFGLEDREPIYVVNLTVRGQPQSADLQGVLGFMDEGRSLIVTSFRDMTTDAMHARWGLQ